MTVKVNCKTCFSEINERASKCPVCLTDQSDFLRSAKRVSKYVGVFGAIVSFVVAVYPLYPLINSAWFPNPSIEVFSIETKLKDKSLSKVSLLNDGNVDIFINKIEFRSNQEEFKFIRSQTIEFNEWIKTGGISVRRFARPRADSNKWSYLTIGGYKKRLALVVKNKKSEYAKACFQLKVYDKDFNQSPLPGIIDLIPVEGETYYSSTKKRKVETLKSNHIFWSLIGFYESTKCDPERFSMQG